MLRTRPALPAIQIIQNIVNSPQINVTCFCVAKIVLMSAWPQRRRPDSVFPQTAGHRCSTKAAAILSSHEKDMCLIWIFHKRTLTLMITNIIFITSHHCQSGSSHRSGVQYCFVDNLPAYMRIDIGIYLCSCVCPRVCVHIESKPVWGSGNVRRCPWCWSHSLPWNFK